MEEWKPIIKFPGYLISSFGNVMSLKRYAKTNKRLLNQRPDRYGYNTVCLRKISRKHNKTVHRLVALHFLDKKSSKHVVNHKDGNKMNNNIENLEFVSVKANIRHARDVLGCYRGSRNPNVKITMQIANRIRALYIPFKMTRIELARKYGLTKGHIDRILANKAWQI